MATVMSNVAFRAPLSDAEDPREVADEEAADRDTPPTARNVTAASDVQSRITRDAW